jgi:uridine phosphorylase
VADHLRPSAEIPPDALLPGDPGRALALAQALVAKPRMSNHSRGLWGYVGTTAAGCAVTIQATGIGGPSIAIVIAELAAHGVRRGIRLGTCRAVSPALAAGELVLVERATGTDGVSAALGAAEPDSALVEALRSVGHGLRPAHLASTDLYYEPGTVRGAVPAHGAGVDAADLGTAAMLAAGAAHGVAAASVLVVVEDARGSRLSAEDAEAGALRLGEIAAAALAGGREDQPASEAAGAPSAGRDA